MWQVVKENPEQALYMLLGSFPFGSVLCFVAFICFCGFAITTADAASHFIARQVAPGEEHSSLAMRVLWGCVIGMTGIIFQVSGGFSAIKSLAISGGTLFVLVMIAYIISIWRMMHADFPTSEGRS